MHTYIHIYTYVCGCVCGCVWACVCISQTPTYIYGVSMESDTHE